MSICGLCVCVHEREALIITQCGKFSGVKHSGLSCVPCCLGFGVAGSMSLRVRQLDVPAETKTKDNVFVTLKVAVQFQVEKKDVYNAYYKLSDPTRQIRAYVCDVIRSSVPKLTVDQVFEQKEGIAKSIKEELSNIMNDLGYKIIEALVIDIDPDPKVKDAMNEINAAQRLRMANMERAEAEKITSVKAAEAEAESKHLAGLGIARQRKAIADGLKESVLSFTGNVEGATAKEVMDLVLITQYFDTLKDMGESAGTSAIFLPHTPSSVSEVAAQIKGGSAGGEKKHKSKK